MECKPARTEELSKYRKIISDAPEMWLSDVVCTVVLLT
jgi:hypothetical protein